MHAVVVVLLRPKQSLFSLGLFFVVVDGPLSFRAPGSVCVFVCGVDVFFFFFSFRLCGGCVSRTLLFDWDGFLVLYMFPRPRQAWGCPLQSSPSIHIPVRFLPFAFDVKVVLTKERGAREGIVVVGESVGVW